MAVGRRIAWGHSLTGIGVLVRRVSLPLALAASVMVLLVALVPKPASVEGVWLLALPAATFVLSRLFAVGLGALGWLVFPEAHRTLLAGLASHVRVHADQPLPGHPTRG